MINTNHTKKLGLKYGGFYALLYILILVIEESFAFDNTLFISIGGLVVSFLMVWQAINDHKNLEGEIPSLPTSLKIGLAIGVIGGLGYAVYLYFNYSYFNTSFIENAQEQIESQLLLQKENGQFKTDEEFEIAENAAKLFASPFFYATFALVGQLLKAFIFSLIIGLLNKSKTT